MPSQDLIRSVMTRLSSRSLLSGRLEIERRLVEAKKVRITIISIS